MAYKVKAAKVGTLPDSETPAGCGVLFQAFLEGIMPRSAVAILHTSLHRQMRTVCVTECGRELCCDGWDAFPGSLPTLSYMLSVSSVP